MKSTYISVLVVVGVTFFGVRAFGNPFSDEARYRIEYIGQSGKTLWGNYTITPHNKSNGTTTERVIGQLPQSVEFTTKKNAIISANGSIATQEPIAIEIYKNGVKCSNSKGTRVSDTIICR